jgi:hypothetical protein
MSKFIVKTLVYIAKDYENTTLSIVLAPTKRDAEVYWQGMGIIPNTVREIDPENIGTPLGLLDILKATKMSNVGDAHPGFKNAVIVKKGY